MIYWIKINKLLQCILETLTCSVPIDACTTRCVCSRDNEPVHTIPACLKVVVADRIFVRTEYVVYLPFSEKRQVLGSVAVNVALNQIIYITWICFFFRDERRQRDQLILRHQSKHGDSKTSENTRRHRHRNATATVARTVMRVSPVEGYYRS